MADTAETNPYLCSQALLFLLHLALLVDWQNPDVSVNAEACALLDLTLTVFQYSDILPMQILWSLSTKSYSHGNAIAALRQSVPAVNNLCSSVYMQTLSGTSSVQSPAASTWCILCRTTLLVYWWIKSSSSRQAKISNKLCREFWQTCRACTSTIS